MDKRDILICVSLFFVAFLIRAVGVANVCMYPDEWLYWEDINRILVSDFAPRAEVFDYASPFFPYIGAVFTLLFEGDLNAIRVISVVFGSLSVPFLYLFGKEMYNRKTGLLSALFLCFSSYHSLYSRIIMLEAFTLFFVIAFLYFFWRSQRAEQEKKGLTYACLAGVMMGLAFVAKYITFFLIPAVILYILWTKRFNFKALLDRKLILTLGFAFLLFLPLLICLFYTGVGSHGLYFYSVGKFEKTGAQGRLSTFGITEMLQRGFETVTGLFAWGSDELIPTGEALFNLSAILLFLMAILFYLFRFAKREREGSFLIISVFSLYLLLLGCPPYKHYQIYTFPFYFVMISGFIITCFENKHKILSTFIASTAVIMIFLYIATGVTSPYWDEGEYSGVMSALEYIKGDMRGGDHHILIGTTFREPTMDYSIYLHNFNATTIRIIETTGEYERRKYKLNIEKISTIKPDYLVILEHKSRRYYLRGAVEKTILEDYKVIHQFNRYFAQYLILKRTNGSMKESFSIKGEGEISKDVFKRSIPSVMEIGKSYTALVQVKNTGESRTDFYVTLRSEEFMLFEEEAREITLDKGSMRTLKFKMVPLKEYVGELPVMVNLYVTSRNETFMRKKVDSVSDYIHLVER